MTLSSKFVLGENQTYALPGGQLRKSFLLVGRSFRTEPRIYFWAISASALFGLLTVAVSKVIGWLTDTRIVPILRGEAPLRSIWSGAAVLFIVIVCLALAVAGRRIFAAWGTYTLQTHHRMALSKKFTTLDPAWFKQKSTGELLSNVSSDAEAATTVFNPLPYMIGSIIMFAVSGVMLILVDVWLAVAAVVILPLMIIANLVFQKYMTPAVTLAQHLRGEVSQVAHESFEGATLIKALGSRGQEEKRFAASTDKLRQANLRVGLLRAVFDPIVDSLPHIGTLLVIAVGVTRINSGAVAPGDVVTAAYLMSLLAVPARSFGWVLADMPRSVVGFDRVAAVVDEKITMVPGYLSRNSTNRSVEFSEVDYVVANGSEEVVLLQGVSFVAEPGKRTVIMGRTGAGKTTLVSLVARLWDPSSGSVYVGSDNVKTLSREALSQSVAFVSQGSFVFEDTIRANVSLGSDQQQYSDDEIWDALEAAQLADFVRGLKHGLDTQLSEQGSNLSGGQRQRLAIARAVVRKPDILILDDATSALDPQIEQTILGALSSNRTTTVIMVAYRAASAILADHVVFLESGKVIGQGNHEDLLLNLPAYAELVNAYEEGDR